jgi:aspartate/methionine/tyrosine aminotransferase
MKIKLSNTQNSSIIAMGARLMQASKETGQEYLMLNRGVNSVVNINLHEVINLIDFNSKDIQVYPGSKGKIELRNAINKEYFNNKADTDNIIITGGGISGLDICLQNIDIDEILLPPFFWGTYTQLCNLRKIPYTCYTDYDSLKQNADKLKNKAVIICDPGNPLGEKYPDNLLLEVMKTLNNTGATVLFDSPYRRLFYDKTDVFYQKLLTLENVIIIESFSKSLGLSGQRVGFLHNANKIFIDEALLRILYATNGINAFAQILVTKLLTTLQGIDAVTFFKEKTVSDIKANIRFLKDNNLLANELYRQTEPVGIFTVINKSPEELFQNRIGSVGLDYFIKDNFIDIDKYSRILVSYPHKKFVSFFKTLL